MKRPKLNQVLALTVALTAGIASQGCGSESGGAARMPVEDESTPRSAAFDEFAIRAFVETPDGERHPLKILPADVNSAGRAASNSTSELGYDSIDAQINPGRQRRASGDARTVEQEVLIEEDAKPQVDSLEEDIANGFAPGWTLTLLAARACAKGSHAAQVLNRPPIEVDGSFFSGAEHFQGGFFIFNDKQPEGVGSCDGLLRAQEIMMCTADKLVEIADSVGTVTWDVNYKGAGAEGTGGDPSGIDTAKLVIPPQRTADRFVARDMAMNVLGQLAASEWYIPGNDKAKLLPNHETCTDAYLDSAVNGFAPVTGFGPGGDGNIYDAYGWPEELRPFIQGNSWNEIGQARLDMRANILAGAARLMRKLIVDTVRDDLATAEAARARAGDPVQGRREFWGYIPFSSETNPHGQPIYGTVNHALWKLFGRLEVGPGSFAEDFVWDRDNVRFRDVPNCESGSPQPGISAAGTYHTNQKLAQVVPPTTNGQALALGMVQHAGVVAPSGALDEPGDELGLKDIVREILSAQFEAADDDDPSQGVSASVSSAGNIQQVLALLTDADLAFAMRRAGVLYELYGSLGVDELENGDTEFSSAAASKGLVQIDGGLPVDEISNHNALYTYFYSLRTRGQCSGSISPSDDDPNFDPTVALQGVFPFAQTVSRRLRFIKPGLSTQASAAIDLARAEIREWAGEGFITNTGNIIQVYGIDAADYGLTKQEFLARLEVVPAFGRPSDCLLGVRTRCEGVEGLTAPLSRAESSVQEGGYPLYVLTLGGWPGGNLPHELVLRATDEDAGASLGAVYPSAWGKHDVDVVSPLRAQLLDRVVSGKSVGLAESTCAANGAVGLPEAYCLEGMERDMYVPLSNSLNSTGNGETEDSWRHYLSQAKEAAAYADELGRELIAQGIDISIEKEQAAEEFAELCGVFPTENDVIVEDGVATVLPGNEAISNCVEPEKVDVVFLRRSPFETPEAAADVLCEVGAFSFCEDGEAIAVPTIAELGLENSSPVPFDLSQTYCQDILDAVDILGPGARSVNRGLYHDVLNKPYATPDSLLYALNALELRTYENDHWVLLSGGHPVLGTEVVNAFPTVNLADIYPMCLEQAGGCSEFANLMASAFSSGTLLTAAESRKEMRLMLERSIFHLGALAGRIPHGTFLLPIPAEIVDSESSNEVAVPALYGHGEFVPESDYWVYDGNNDEQLAMAHWVRASDETSYRQRWSTPNPEGTDEHPAEWRKEMFENLGDFVVQGRYNEEMLFVEGHDLDGQPRGLINQAMHDWISSWEESCGYGSFVQSIHAISGAPTYGKVGQENQLVTVGFQEPEPIQRVGAGPVERPVCRRSLEHSAGFYTFTHISSEFSDLSPNIPYFDRNSGLFATHTVKRQDQLNGIAFIHPDDLPGIDTSLDPDGDLYRWSDVVPNSGCNTGRSWSLYQDCLDFSEWHPLDATSVRAQARFSPQRCLPSERVEMFLHKEVANDCEAMDAVSQALMLSCVAGSYRPSVDSSLVPPEINTANDMYLLESWMRKSADAIHHIAGAQFLIDVPAQAVAVAQGDSLDHDAVGMGDRGQAILDLEQSMRNMESGFAGVSAAFNRLGLSVRDARLGLESIQLEEQASVLSLLNQQMNVERELAILDATQSYTTMKWAGNAVTRNTSAIQSGANLGRSVGGIWGAAVGAIAGGAAATVGWYGEMMTELVTRRVNGEYFGMMSQNYDEQIALAGELADIAEARQLVDVNLDTHLAREDTRLAIEQINGSANAALKSLNTLSQVEMNARRALAKLAGADFVETEQGKIPLELSTVYRRLYDVKSLRYQRALEAAKRAAYLARLAIEQRLGVRMRNLHESIGPIEPPAVWADDLCSLTGVDYEALSAQAGEDESELLGAFADQYIGDYVEQLEEFVEYYNVEYPFGESPDRAVISLRDHAQAVNQTCSELNPNLLVHSNYLGATGADSDLNDLGVWRATDCRSSRCIAVTSVGAGLFEGELDADELRSPSGGAGYNLFGEVPYLEPETSSGGPDGWFFQNVELEAGTDYSLTFWDGAVAETSNSEVSYQVAVYDEHWSPVAIEFPTVVSTGDVKDVWGERVLVKFTAPQTGIYRVAIGEVEPDSGTQLALANFQLEAGDSTTYRENDARRTVVAKSCRGNSPENFRDGFEYVCEGDDCFYRSTFPFYLDEEFLAAGSGVFAGGIGAGNSNYRIEGVALNVVGSGVLDCSESSTSCYNNGFLGYDLHHHTGSVALTSQPSGVTCFDFKTGAVRGGKALATERVLSLPLSSADSALVLEPGTYKSELAGRPLSGSYRLKIWDQPELRWEQIEDIQLLVDYRYWSAVK